MVTEKATRHLFKYLGQALIDIAEGKVNLPPFGEGDVKTRIYPYHGFTPYRSDPSKVAYRFEMALLITEDENRCKRFVDKIEEFGQEIGVTTKISDWRPHTMRAPPV